VVVPNFKDTLASVLGLATLTTMVACGGETDTSGDPAVARGELIYRNICVVCHNADPNEDGTLGPAIVQATRELLEAKVLRGEYPAGYTPARDTKQMPQFEYLEPNLDDIEAFIASRRK
jgi:mono/diheme cytochrome c family protein